MNDDMIGAIDTLDDHIKSAHKGKKKRSEVSVVTISMDNVNKLFDEYVSTLSNTSATDDNVNTSLLRYMSARKAVTAEVMKADRDKWTDVLKESDSKAFWKLVDWKGNLRKKKSYCFTDNTGIRSILPRPLQVQQQG